MQPVCVFIIIVLGFIALWLLASDSKSTPAAPEYYPSGATALPPSTRYADMAGPLPDNPSKMIVPPRNPAFGAYDRFMIRNAKNEERGGVRETYHPITHKNYGYQVPSPQWRYRGKHPTPQDYAAANYLAHRFFPTDRNTITDTMF